MLYVDTKTWLPDDLLIKADRITMANSIELRVPLLDHVILEWACKLPSSYKLSWLDTKHIMKEAFRRDLPQEIVNRKKTGFPVPYDRWFRAELKGYVRDLLLDKKTIERGLFNKQEIEKLLEQKEETTASADIFSLVAVEWWHRIFIDGGSTIQVPERQVGRSDE
jgi:asparagine synthase (glutamine-hydrolysing)